MLENIIKKALEKEASDIHIISNKVYLRVHGDLVEELEMSEQEQDHIISTLIGEKELKNDMDFSYSIKDLCRTRVNIAKQREHYSATLRIVNTEVPKRESLGIPKMLDNIMHKNKGLFIVTGPTGSGKSTTLAAMIDYINSVSSKKIVTLEDPIEYLHENKKSVIMQREIGEDTTFKKGLTACLRQDPDIILVGEMRDEETVKTALRAAETGHLVLTTLHTIGTANTLTRIIDQFPDSKREQICIQLSNTLIGVFSQNLIKSVKGDRVVAYEVMIMDKGLRNIIKENKVHTIEQYMQTSRDCILLEKNLEQLKKEGLINNKQIEDLLIDYR